MNRIVLVFIVCGIAILQSYFVATIDQSVGRRPKLDGRIVGGVETSIKNFPHQVSVQRNGRHACGGSIYHERVVLTAAHCIRDNRQDSYSIRAGSSEHLQGGIIRKVVQIITHEMYNQPSALNNDIAILILNEKLQYNAFIQSIPIATESDLSSPGIAFFVSGWGATSSTAGLVVSHLRYTIVNEINHNVCISAYRYITPITDGMFCAGTKNGGRDSCQGDSGGPLTVSLNDKMSLAGIVSWGIGCAHKDFPGVYTKASNYVNWIGTKLRDSNIQ